MSQAWRRSVILAAQDAEAGGFRVYGLPGLELVKDQPGQFSEMSEIKIEERKQGICSLMVDCLSWVHEAPCSVPRTSK